MLRALIATIVREALNALTGSGRLSGPVTSEIEVSDPRNPEHGDFALNIALVASKGLGMNPRAFAELLMAELTNRPEFTSVEVAGPGFINLRLDPAFVATHVQWALTTDLVRALPDATPKRINVEFVSVNPNGPITIGSGRGAAYGSALCNVLEAAGHTVSREYYVNDSINSEQMRLFTESVKALIDDEPIPENGYKGDYVHDVASEINLRLNLARTGEDGAFKYRYADPRKRDFNGELVIDPPVFEGDFGLSPYTDADGNVVNQHVDLDNPFARNLAIRELVEPLMVTAQHQALAAFGVYFHTWFSESSLYYPLGPFEIATDEVDAAMRELQSKGLADDEAYRTVHKMGRGGKIEETTREEQPNDEEDVAGEGKTLWLRSTLLGDDMDRVLRRRDGRLTYIASDVAYHKDKFNRPPSADKLITILGPDHHGYIARLRAVVAAMLAKPGQDPAEALKETDERFEVIIYQLVRFLKDGQPAPMRKRDGNIYALLDLLKEIGAMVKPDAPEEEQLRSGKDVARFFYLQRSHDSMFDFDLDLAARQSDENPVFYVQYAHARICSVLRKAEEAGLTASEYTPDQLSHPKEVALGKLILDLPNEVRRAAADYGVHRIATYAVELARGYHGFYDSCRVIQPDQPALSAARLDLCRAAAKALREALALIGVDAPERMERAARTEEE